MQILNRTLATLAAATLLAAAVMLSAAPGTAEESPAPAGTSANRRTATAEVRKITEWYEAVGTVIPKTQAAIEAQVAAQVKEVTVQPGSQVKDGDVLVRLEDSRLQSRLAQARQSLQSAIARREEARQEVNGAEAALSQASSAFKRVEKFYAAQAVPEQEYEAARSHFLQAKAALQRAEEGLSGAAAGIRLAEKMVEEAEISLAYATIVAPADGEVLKRLVDPGDMATPGKPLVLLRTAEGLQLEANVRERLINRVAPGDSRTVLITSLERKVPAIIAEVVPFIDPQTRTFLVKADLTATEGIYPGMYGKLLIPYRDVEVVLLPPEAVAQTGQLELVRLKKGDGFEKRYVTTGNRHGDSIEILSGLQGGETVLLRENGTP